MAFKPQKPLQPRAPACSIELKVRTVSPTMPCAFSAQSICFGTGSIIFDTPEFLKIGCPTEGYMSENCPRQTQGCQTHFFVG
jgi:hypothetical protein